MKPYRYLPRGNHTKSLFFGTMAECEAHVAALKKNIKGYKYQIRGRGRRSIHIGKARLRPYTKSGFSRNNYFYNFNTLSHSLPKPFATHGVVYDNLNQLCNSR